jgi:hypothetical protein
MRPTGRLYWTFPWVLLAAGCGGDGRGAASPADATPAVGGAPADGAPPDPDEGVAASPDAAEAADAVAEAADAAADAAPPPSERPRFLDYIRADRYPRLVIEVDRGADVTPNAASVERLRARLEALLQKPVAVEYDDDALPSRPEWPFRELVDLADATFDLDVPDDAIKMHVLYVDGHDAEDQGDLRVLGKAWSHTHLAMFPRSIADACEGAALPLFRDRVCEEAELAILTHEVGHLLGLVDNGLPMVADHVDREHDAHDRDEGCVMYWAYEGGAGLEAVAEALTGGGEAPSFDQACLDDLDAARAP